MYSTNIFSDQTEKMDRLFKTYITPQLKEIYHPAILQEWKLNIDAKECEKMCFYVINHLLKTELIVLTISITGLSQ